jgi:hypothetical protein
MATGVINVYVPLVIAVHDVKIVRISHDLFADHRDIFMVNMIFFCIGDPCAQNPCLNGGQCVPNGVGGFTCVCVSPYTGERCQDCE